MTARTSMKKIREIMRLKLEQKLSNRKVATSLNIGGSTVFDCMKRVKEAQLTWPLDESLDDNALIALLYKKTPSGGSVKGSAVDWAQIHKQLKHKSMTLQLLWENYQAGAEDALSYSRFCTLYRQWRNQLDVDMRQVHKAGEKLFVDYCGMTIPIIINSITGEKHNAQIFVATLGASNYIYVEATLSQNSLDWQASHKRTFEHLGGVPEVLVPDNLKSGVSKACFYDPDINCAYHHLATYYGTTVLPTRVRSPKDKAKVEQAVQHVERRILARLKDTQFRSLSALNEAIKPLMEELNAKPFQKLPGSRQSEFVSVDKPHLKPLPCVPFTVAMWKQVTIGRDYHIGIDEHYYSVPYQYHQKKCEVRCSDSFVEVYYGTKRIAAHQLKNASGKTTLIEHMPKNHQHYASWTLEKMCEWAKEQSDVIAQFIQRLLEQDDHPEKHLRSGSGIKRLCKDYGVERVSMACKRALHINAHEYRSVEWILKNNLDRLPLPQPQEQEKDINHNNVRGGDYFT